MEPHASDRLRAFLILFTSIALAGCTGSLQERQLTMPSSPEAQACVANCELSQQQCRQRQTLREAECNALDARLSSELAACQATPGAICVQPMGCLGPDMTICTAQFEDCIVACGGTLATHWSGLRLSKTAPD